MTTSVSEALRLSAEDAPLQIVTPSGRTYLVCVRGKDLILTQDEASASGTEPSAAPKRTRIGEWVPIPEFVGDAYGCPLVWWWNSAWHINFGRAELDNIYLDEKGRFDSKGDGASDHYTHVMLAGVIRPDPPGRRPSGHTR